MKPDISEFSYGFALVDELIHGDGWPLTAVPIYPSLRDEGQLGYDVELQRNGIPVFLQFKLADCMVRNYAFEVREGYLTVPFYRIHLRPIRKSKQHELLLKLEATGREVYYVAPAFHLPTELNDAYLKKQMRNRSRFFRPSVIGPLDDEPHMVAFQLPGDFVVRSNPVKKGGALDGKGFEREILGAFRQKRREALSDESLRRLGHSMMEMLPEKLDESDTGKEEAFASISQNLKPLGQVAYLARTFFGCELIAVTEKTEQAATKHSGG